MKLFHFQATNACLFHNFHRAKKPLKNDKQVHVADGTSHTILDPT